MSKTIVVACLCARNVLPSSGVQDGLSVFEALARRSTTIVEYMGMMIALRDGISPLQSLPMMGPRVFSPGVAMTTALTHGPVQKLPYLNVDRCDLDCGDESSACGLKASIRERSSFTTIERLLSTHADAGHCIRISYTF